MSDIREALEYAVDLSKANEFDIEGRTYTDKPLLPMIPPRPSALRVNTLSALVTYVMRDPDARGRQWIVHVESPTTVSVIEPIDGNPWELRNEVLTAVFEAKRGFAFGMWLKLEDFIINLQTHFNPCVDLSRILQLVGNLKDEKVRQYADDGITQTVTAKVGITRVEDVLVPNPVILFPRRTFLEVDQPSLTCVFRMRSGREGEGPQCALFEADGSAWELEAMQRIKDFLEVGGIGTQNGHIILA